MFKLITTKWWDKPRVASQAVAKNIVSRELSSRETMFLLSLGDLTDFTRHS